MLTLINTNLMKPPIAPIGLDYIAGAAQNAGIDTDILDLCRHDDPDKAIENYFSRNSPSLVGLSFRNVDDCFWPSAKWFVPQLKDIVKTIKNLTDSPVVIGGVGFSIFPRQIVEYTGADFGVHGDGEQAIVDLYHQLKTAKKFDKVSGLVWRDNGKIVANKPAWQEKLSLETSRNAIDNKWYFSNGGQGGIETKRGCPRKCIYCADPLAKGAVSRTREPAEVADEIERIAARATYQLGMCHLKKDQKEKAAEYFQKVVSNYPAQKTLVEQANQQLNKILRPYTQEMHNEIEPNGIIKFSSPNHIKNKGTEPITNTGFMNSDFVSLTKMVDDKGKPVEFTAEHEGNIYRYSLTFNPPIMPGKELVYTTYGTITGLVNIVPATKDTWRYYMKHSPNTGVPTLRIETYLLPEGAELISTTPPDMEIAEKNGRIELRIEKIIPAGGSLITSFQYKITGAKPAVAKPLKLEPAPWIDGEVMELRLKRPAGNEYGTIIYSAQSSTSDGNNTWQIISHMYVSEGSVSQYTFVEADATSFTPIYGQTTNWMGDFAAEYGKGNVKLTVGAEGNKTTRDVSVEGVAYDNEQAVYLIRRMPLAEGYEGSFPIFTVQGSTTVECRIKVLAVEQATVEAGTFKCYKTELSINSQGVKTLQHTLWFSADEHKYLVKYDVGGAATMELAKVWQKERDRLIIFENVEPALSVAIPADWRFYKYGSGPQFSLQLISPEVKAWALLVWQKRGTDPAFTSAMTIAKTDYEKLKGFFQNYTADRSGFKELKINSLEAVQFAANYQDSGSGLRKYSKPKDMVEYRTYIVDQSNVYWFVFRVEKDKFEENKAEFDSIVKSFKVNAK